MKLRNFILLLTILALATGQSTQAQTPPPSTQVTPAMVDALNCQVNQVYKPLSIDRAQLNEAQNLKDLVSHYKEEWVREYIKVEISASNKGTTRAATTKGFELSPEQKRIMHLADPGTDISLEVDYIPDNTLKNNEPREMHFDFIVNPDFKASYPGGEQALQAYLQEEVLDKIDQDVFTGYKLAAVKFTITEDGEIIDAHVNQSCEDEEIEKAILQAVNNMPNWKPAEYANGQTTSQEFVLMLGNFQNCMVNTFGIRKL